MPLLLPQFRDAGDSQATVESSWRGTRSVTDAEGQTDPIATSHQRTQEPKVLEAESQTAPVDQGQQTDDLTPSQPNRFVGDSAHLNAFLHESTAALEEQMLRNLTTSAFDGHTVSWEEEHDQVSCLHSLKHRGALASTAPEACSALAWNAGGTVLAAAYGPLDRTDWASQSSMLCTWSVFRRQLDPAKADLALELQECLTCLAFHPEDPSLLAGGAFNGDVLVWNLAATEDKLVGKSTLCNYTHHEPVQRVCWTKDPLHRGHRGYLLCSIAADGKVCMGRLLAPTPTLTPTLTPTPTLILIPTPTLILTPTPTPTLIPSLTRTKVLMWSLGASGAAGGGGLPAMGFLLPMPSVGKARANATPQGEGMHAGGSALCFSKEDPTSFIVGLESGQLYKCSTVAKEARSAEAVMRTQGELPWSTAAAALVTGVPASHYHRLKQRAEKDGVLARERQVTPRIVYDTRPSPSTLFAPPISFAYDKHSGPVHEVQFSPFHRNIFLSVASDSTARLYSVLQPRPVHVVEPSSSSLFGVAWSTARPLVFAVAAADGSLSLYDLKRSRGRPDVVLQVTSNRSPVYGVAFNPKNGNLLATADAQGFVKVWRLSTQLSTMGANELAQLEKLATARAAGGAEEAAEEDEGDAAGYGEGDDDFE